MTKPTQRQIVQLKSLRASFRADMTITANAVVDQVREVEGINLTMKRTVYRAMDKLRDEDIHQVRSSYRKIASYLAAFQELNPGSLAVAEKDAESRFRRAAVVVGAFVHASQACQKVVGIDCSHSKSRHYSGVQVHLVGRDGNLKNITLAFGLVLSEDAESYLWFLDKVEAAGFSLAEIPVFCDRGGALLAAGGDLRLNLRFCTLHIMRNVIHKFGKLSREDKNLVWSIQACETLEAYESKLAAIEIALGAPVRKYLAEIAPERWCVFANIKKMPLYGWRTSNFVESVFGTQLITGTRRLHPFDFLKKLCEKLVNDCYERSVNAQAWAPRLPLGQ